MPGPPPKDPAQRRRRNVGPALVALPSEGRSGAAPSWPLSRAVKAEASLWRELWATPQAAAWEQLGWTRIVARYVRCVVQVEGQAPSTRLLAEVRQTEDRLGLTPLALRRLGWTIVADEVAEARTVGKKRSRDRLRAVDPGAVAGT